MPMNLTPTQLARLKTFFAQHKVEYAALLADSKKLGKMTPSQLATFGGKVNKAYARMKQQAGRAGGVDCLNQCQTDYSKCLQRNSAALCKLDALGCVAACVARGVKKAMGTALL